MTFTPLELADVVTLVRTTALDAIVATTADPDADPPVEGIPPSFVFTDVTATFRHPSLVCDDGALVVWVARSDPSRDRGCLTLAVWEIHARWWVCFPSMGNDGTPPIDLRQTVAERVQVVAPAVEKALAALTCDPTYGVRAGIRSLAMGTGTPVTPGAGSTGWEWVIRATM